jgi:predicted branched-subunit amino acid permease
MSFIIFAGSAQFFIILLIIEGEIGVALLIAGVVINLRHLLYGAVLYDDIQSEGVKRYLLAYLLTDEAFLVTTLIKKDLETNETNSGIKLEDALLGAGFFQWGIWNLSTIIGYLITPFIQTFLILSADFIVAGTFLGYLVLQFQRGTLPEKRFIGYMSLISLVLSFLIQSTTLLVTTLVIGIIFAGLVEYQGIKSSNDQKLRSNNN